MTDAVLALAVYYSVAILAGMTLFVLGFKLFQQGIAQAPMRVGAGAGAGLDPSAGLAPGATGAVNTITPRYSLQLENLAPGTAYALMGTVLVGIGLFKGPPALTAATEKQVEKAALEKVTAEASRDKAFAQANIPSPLDVAMGKMSGGGGGSGYTPSPRPSDGTGSSVKVPVSTPVTSFQFPMTGFLPGVTAKSQAESLEQQISALSKQRDELKHLTEALKKVGDAKQLSAEEKDVLTEWLLYHRLPSGPPGTRPVISP